MDPTEKTLEDLRDLNRRVMQNPNINVSAYIDELKLSVGLVEGWKEFVQDLYKQAGYQ